MSYTLLVREKKSMDIRTYTLNDIMFNDIMYNQFWITVVYHKSCVSS